MIIAGIVCDKCGDKLIWHHISKLYIVEWAREKGWSVGKKTLCPKCRRKRKPEQEDSHEIG